MRIEFIEELEKSDPNISEVSRKLLKEIEADSIEKKEAVFKDVQDASSIAFVLSKSTGEESISYRLARAMIEDLKNEYKKEHGHA